LRAKKQSSSRARKDWIASSQVLLAMTAETLRSARGGSIKKKKPFWEAELRAIAVLGIALLAATPAAAQKSGGILRLYHNDNPPSASLLEESTIASVTPFAAVFNNLVVFDPSKVHESIETVIPDLAESWSWDATNTKLTFRLRQGVKWHDAHPADRHGAVQIR
jgi:ABC-type transport system substrate-binding protein